MEVATMFEIIKYLEDKIVKLNDRIVHASHIELQLRYRIQELEFRLLKT